MYKHVLIRLKHKPGQKLSELNAMRKEIDEVMTRDFSNDISRVFSFDAPSTFACELTNAYNGPHDVPAKMKAFLDTWKSVDNYSPAVATALEDNEAPPSVDNIMTSFQNFAKTVDYTGVDAYSLRLQPCRHTSVPVKQLSELLRDNIAEYMEKEYTVVSERSYSHKQKVDAALAAATAEAAKIPNSVAPSKKQVEADLNVPVFQFDLFKNIGFWAHTRFTGVGAPKSKEALTAEKRAQVALATPEQRIGDRVVIIKIGEIFLKKGNRFKFMLQLQSNIQFKVMGKGHVSRKHHFYIVAPEVRSEMNRVTGRSERITPAPFTDAQLKDIVDIVKCIPGVENVAVAMRTVSDISSITATTQYMAAAAAMGNALPVTAHTPVYNHSIATVTDDNRAGIISFLSGDYPKDHKADRCVAAGDALNTITRLGFRFEAHTHQPCPFESRTMLAKMVGDNNRVTAGTLLGLDEPIPHPGQIAAQLREASGEAVDEDAPASAWVQPQSGVEIRAEINADYSYLYFSSGPDHVEAVGGQPTGTMGETQTVVALLSGGMDSPVAAFSLMRRGMRVVLVHFQNANLADEDTVKHKIVQLAEHLSRFQIITYLHIVPFSAIQDAIIMEVPSPARMLVYRRFMFHVAARVAHKYHARFLVLGDALGQVASQTSANLYASYTNTPLPLLSPLIGSNKKDIMNIAKEIGTYDISALPYGDCCSYFLAKHPLTKIKAEVLAQYEAAVGQNVPGGARRLIGEAYGAAAVVRWHKPADGMMTLRELMPVRSHHNNATKDLLLQCPTRPRDDDDMEDAEVTAADVARRQKDEEEQMKAEADAVLRDDDDAMSVSDEETPVDVAPLTANTVVVDNDVSPKHTAKKARTTTGEDVTVTLPSTRTKVVNAYLDNAATTRVFPEVVKAMLPYLSGDLFGNTSSQHALGSTTHAATEEARRVLLGVINAPTQGAKAMERDDAIVVPGQKHTKKVKDQLMVFTSGGTEANNLALLGSVRSAVESTINDMKHLIVQASAECKLDPRFTSSAVKLTSKPVTLCVHLVSSGLEHSAVLEPLRRLVAEPHLALAGINVQALPFTVDLKVSLSLLKNDAHGVVDLNHLDHALKADFDNTQGFHVLTLASVMHANNEVGVVQPLVQIGQALQAHSQALTAKYNSLVSQVSNGEDVPNTFYGVTRTTPVLFHSDACQSIGKLHLDVQECNLDLVTINGHKLHGPKGVGALFVRPGVSLCPLTVGGGHEGNLRSGTLNVPGIVGMAAAAAHIFGIETALLDPMVPAYPITTPIKRSNPLPQGTVTSVGVATERNLRTAQLVQDLRQFLYVHFPRSFINGPRVVADGEGAFKHTTPLANDMKSALKSSTETISLEEYISSFGSVPQQRLPNILSIVLDRSSWLDASSVIKFLSARGVFVSSGSACASNSEPAPSHVLLGMGVRDVHANATVRISLGHLSTQEEVEFAKKALSELAVQMKKNFVPQSR